MHAEAVMRFTDDSADTRNLELQEGCVTELDLEAIEARAKTYRGYYWGPFYPYPVFDDVPQLVARVRALVELIAALELDKRRLDVLEELIKQNRGLVISSGRLVVFGEDGPSGRLRASFRAAADAEIARSLLTTRTPEQGESKKVTEYPTVITTETLPLWADKSDAEIAHDIADTEREIIELQEVQRREEAAANSTAIGEMERRMAGFKASARPHQIAERREFIAFLRRIQEARAGGVRTKSKAEENARLRKKWLPSREPKSEVRDEAGEVIGEQG
jgi:hypothetical protein